MSRMLLGLLVVVIAFSGDRQSIAQDDPFQAGPPRAAKQDRNVLREAAAKHRFADVLGKAKAALAKGHQPAEVQGWNQSDLEKRVFAALDEETTLDVVNAPLDDVCDMISKLHDIPVLVDRRALEEIGLSQDNPVSISVNKTTLRNTLRLMLREADLTYAVRNEVLIMTTVAAAEQNLSIKMFRLRGKLAENSDTVVQAVQRVVTPDTWSVLGGPSTALVVDDVLVVSTTIDVSDRVEQFLSQLAEKMK